MDDMVGDPFGVVLMVREAKGAFLSFERTTIPQNQDFVKPALQLNWLYLAKKEISKMALLSHFVLFLLDFH